MMCYFKRWEIIETLRKKVMISAVMKLRIQIKVKNRKNYLVGQNVVSTSTESRKRTHQRTEERLAREGSIWSGPACIRCKCMEGYILFRLRKQWRERQDHERNKCQNRWVWVIWYLKESVVEGLKWQVIVQHLSREIQMRFNSYCNIVFY